MQQAHLESHQPAIKQTNYQMVVRSNGELVHAVHFDQLSGPAHTRKLVELLFQLFQPFLLKKVKNDQKRLKTAEKSSLNSFRVRAAQMPESPFNPAFHGEVLLIPRFQYYMD